MAYGLSAQDDRNLQKMITGYQVAVLELLEDEDPDTGEIISARNAEFDRSAVDYIKRICRKFMEETLSNPNLKNVMDYDWNQVGTDLYLTQEGHGTGFWDRPDLYGGDTDILDKMVESGFKWADFQYDPETNLIYSIK